MDHRHALCAHCAHRLARQSCLLCGRLVCQECTVLRACPGCLRQRPLAVAGVIVRLRATRLWRSRPARALRLVAWSLAFGPLAALVATVAFLRSRAMAKVLGVVIVVWMGLVGLSVHSKFGRHDAMTRTRLAITTAEQAIAHYLLEHDTPCAALVADSLMNGPPDQMEPGTPLDDLRPGYLTHRPVDGWGTPLGYRCRIDGREESVEVVSAGPDQRFGTADDVLAE